MSEITGIWVPTPQPDDREQRPRRRGPCRAPRWTPQAPAGPRDRRPPQLGRAERGDRADGLAHPPAGGRPAARAARGARNSIGIRRPQQRQGGEAHRQRKAKAIAIPSTRSRAKPRTIGIGERTRTQNPAAVARPAVAITGPPRAAASTAARGGEEPLAQRLDEARLELDRVVDRQPDQDGQHGDRGHGQRTADERQEPERDPCRAERDAERQEPERGAEHERERDHHRRERRRQQDEDLRRELLRQALEHDRHAAHHVARLRRPERREALQVEGGVLGRPA